MGRADRFAKISSVRFVPTDPNGPSSFQTPTPKFGRMEDLFVKAIVWEWPKHIQGFLRSPVDPIA
jgi:hypothetical protein